MARLEQLRHIAPAKANPRIEFPEHYPGGRITVELGQRLLDWESDRWVPYQKEGVRWYREELREVDRMALEVALRPQL
jgi:hypothetical protein